MNQVELIGISETASAELLQAVSRTVARALRVLRIPVPVRLSVWAERNFYLSAESSYVEGRWRSWPFQAGMLDMMGHDEVHHVTIRKSARVGYTKMLLAFVCYMAEHKRRNGVVYQPTDDDRDEFVTTELDPVLRDVRAMRRVMPRMHSRSKDNTMRQKKFTTGLLHLRGGKAAKNYRRLTCDFVVYDEFSGFDRDVEKEGSPGKLGDKRLEGAVWPKSMAGSTPKLKHNDNTEDREVEADANLRWHVPCPHCDELHQITWGGKDKPHGLKWTGDDPATVAHVCPHCGGLMTQAEYLRVWHAGVWIDTATGAWLDSGRIHPSADACMRTAASLDWRVCELPGRRDEATVLPPPGHVAMPIWTACAPQATWTGIVEEFLAAVRLAERGDFSLLKTFINTTLGETWEERGEAQDEHELQRRAEPYPLRVVPVGALVLTCGIDVQRDRWECGVWGWGHGMESWVIDHQVIEGNPSNPEDWAPVRQFLQRRYPQAWAQGQSLPIESTSIDSSDNTQAVYDFVHSCAGQIRIHAIKGSSEEGKPIKGTATVQDVNYRGRVRKRGVKVWVIGVDTAKDLLLGQLALPQPLPGQRRAGYVHTSQDLPREWYEQLTAEQRVLVRTPRGEAYRWMKRRPRNEVLDCRNYATHAAFVRELHRYTERQWDQLAAAVQPAPDLFTHQALPAAVSAVFERVIAAKPTPAQEAKPAAPVRSAAPVGVEQVASPSLQALLAARKKARHQHVR